jgi:glutamate/tyrosine decarboxylase-like PLP-dependent enzyme
MSADSHGSILKAARVCGLGSGAVRSLPTRRPSFVVDPQDLENAIAEDQKNGCFPLMIVGTAGTTSTGALDPLGQLAALARKHGAWFHVDAAWGGSACLSPKLRTHVAGIELADSVTWDAHKWLSVPFSAGMFFSRHVESVHTAFSIQTGYMPAKVGQALDPYATTIQWTRRNMGLKVFMSLAELGLDGYRKLIEEQTEMGNFLRRRLTEEGYEVVNDTPLPLSCFTHPLIREGKATTTEVLDRVYSRGKVWISDVAPGEGERLLRACVTHYGTTQDDIECLIDEMNRALSA